MAHSLQARLQRCGPCTGSSQNAATRRPLLRVRSVSSSSSDGSQTTSRAWPHVAQKQPASSNSGSSSADDAASATSPVSSAPPAPAPGPPAQPKPSASSPTPAKGKPSGPWPSWLPQPWAQPNAKQPAQAAPPKPAPQKPAPSPPSPPSASTSAPQSMQQQPPSSTLRPTASAQSQASSSNTFPGPGKANAPPAPMRESQPSMAPAPASPAPKAASQASSPQLTQPQAQQSQPSPPTSTSTKSPSPSSAEAPSPPSTKTSTATQATPAQATPAQAAGPKGAAPSAAAAEVEAAPGPTPKPNTSPQAPNPQAWVTPQSAKASEVAASVAATSSSSSTGSAGAGPSQGQAQRPAMAQPAPVQAQGPATPQEQVPRSAPTADQASSGQVQGAGQASTGSEQASRGQEQAPPASWLAANASMARKVLATADASAVEELLLGEPWPSPSLSESDCRELIVAALDKGNIALALSMHDAMRAARRTGVARPSYDGAFVWPPASIQSTGQLVLGLCKQVAITEAVRAILDIRTPVPRNEEVGFGKVISSPLAPGRTLTVVQPQEGFKLVADAYSKYEYEVFSGKVTSCSSEQMQSQANNPLFMLARALGFQRSMPAAAVHTVTVQAPDGTARTLRFATETSDVPAQVGERVTAVCAPFKNSAKGRRAVFSASPPGRKPGEAMQMTNHKTGVITMLLQPPTSATQAAFPSWVLPAVALLAGGDAASSLIDPSLPAMIAIGSAITIGSVTTGTNVLVPRLKQLSDRDVSMEYMRQQLLGQYAQLARKSDEVSQEATEDVRVLAKLWQLQSKMESVGHTAAAYQARIGRIAKARQNIEERLTKKLELLDGYARVMNMIEIEVEMDIEVPAAELQGIEQQLVRLTELEGLQDDWRLQAEARDEVEKLLRAP